VREEDTIDLNNIIIFCFKKAESINWSKVLNAGGYRTPFWRRETAAFVKRLRVGGGKKNLFNFFPFLFFIFCSL